MTKKQQPVSRQRFTTTKIKGCLPDRGEWLAKFPNALRLTVSDYAPNTVPFQGPESAGYREVVESAAKRAQVLFVKRPQISAFGMSSKPRYYVPLKEKAK